MNTIHYLEHKIFTIFNKWCLIYCYFNFAKVFEMDISSTILRFVVVQYVIVSVYHLNIVHPNDSNVTSYVD